MATIRTKSSYKPPGGPVLLTQPGVREANGNLAVAGQASASGLNRKETQSGIQYERVPWPASFLIGDV